MMKTTTGLLALTRLTFDSKDISSEVQRAYKDGRCVAAVTNKGHP